MRHRQGAAPHAVSHLPSAKILTPEKRLKLAILRDTVACLKRVCGINPALLSTRARDDRVDTASRPRVVFSFEVICDALNLDAAALRPELLEMGLSKRLIGQAQGQESPPYTAKLRANRP